MPGGRSEARQPGAAPGSRSEVRADAPARSDAPTPGAVGTLTPDAPDAGSLREQREPLTAAGTPRGHETGAAGATRGATGRPEHRGADEARQRLGLAQAALLSALVAGTPVPEGFDRVRVGVQARALAAKRADVVAKVAPELPEILGTEYRAAFLAYAQAQPMTGGYRRDALTFAEHLLSAGRPGDAAARRELREWWLERSGPAPRSRRPVHRLARATRKVLLRR
jgi:hypothetical protein